MRYALVLILLVSSYFCVLAILIYQWLVIWTDAIFNNLVAILKKKDFDRGQGVNIA